MYKPEHLRISGVDLYYLTPSAELPPNWRGALDPLERERASQFLTPARQNDFLKSRYLYRLVSGNKTPLLADQRGAPLWPEGWEGSISHTAGVVFLGLSTNFSNKSSFVGIDVELEKTSVPKDQLILHTQFEALFKLCYRVFGSEFDVGQMDRLLSSQKVASVDPSRTIPSDSLSFVFSRIPVPFQIVVQTSEILVDRQKFVLSTAKIDG